MPNLLQEFIDSIHQFAGSSAENKIKFLFKVYDLDGDGLIQHKELQHVMRACMDENGMQFSESQIDDLTMAMFDDADPFHRGAITYEALKNQLEKHGGLLENLTISIDRWLVPLPQEPKKVKKPLPHQLTAPYLKNNYVYLVFLGLFIIINVALFISRAIQYRHSNGFVILARACGKIELNRSQSNHYNSSFLRTMLKLQLHLGASTDASEIDHVPAIEAGPRSSTSARPSHLPAQIGRHDDRWLQHNSHDHASVQFL